MSDRITESIRRLVREWRLTSEAKMAEVRAKDEAGQLNPTRAVDLGGAFTFAWCADELERALRDAICEDGQ